MWTTTRRLVDLLVASDPLEPAEGNPTPVLAVPPPPCHVVKFYTCQNISQLAAKAV